MKKKFQAVLKSVSQDIKRCDNLKQTQYRGCVVEFNDKARFAKIWESSYQYGVTLGNTYTCEVQMDGEDFWITVLNGPQATVATKEDFAEMFAELAV
jgi:hypothetical protein